MSLLSARISALEAPSVVAARVAGQRTDMPATSEVVLRARINELTSISVYIELYRLPLNESFASQDEVRARCQELDDNETLEQLERMLTIQVSVSEPAASSACGASVVNYDNEFNRFEVVRSRRDLGSEQLRIVFF